MKGRREGKEGGRESPTEVAKVSRELLASQTEEPPKLMLGGQMAPVGQDWPFSPVAQAPLYGSHFQKGCPSGHDQWAHMAGPSLIEKGKAGLWP